MLNALTLSALRPYATCRKCAFVKNVAKVDHASSPLCMLKPPSTSGEPPRVQSGDFCESWAPASGDIAAEALRILTKRLPGLEREDVPRALADDARALTTFAFRRS